MSDRTPDASDSLSPDLSRKRSILLSTRIRFSPTAQSLREAALERIVELALLLNDPEPLSLPNVLAALRGSVGGGLSTVTEPEVRRLLGLLVDQDRVQGTGEGLRERTYRLTDAGRVEISALETAANESMKRVVQTLFASAHNPDTYLNPFIEAISRVFGSLAESYVELLRGNIDPSEFAAQEAVSEALEAVKQKHPQLDPVVFEHGMNRFLVETDPEFDAIKWNMTQNFYLLTVLGIDSGAYLLSEDVFGGAIFYLDTNVIIAALQPRARFHAEYGRLAAAFRGLHIQIRVCQSTLDELRLVVDYEKTEVQNAASQVPDALEAKVSDRFFHAYREAERTGAADPLGQVFEPFADPIDSLSQLTETELEDDVWFDKERYDVHTADLARELQRVAEGIHPGRPKKERAAQHDALILRWVERIRESETTNAWFLTLDGTLCAFESESAPRGSIHRNLALTLDAVLLWLAPIVSIGGIVGEGMADIFADALRNQLLPKQKLLDLRDFMVFSEIGMECRELPAEDVEDCIRFIERELPGLDSTKAEDRERLGAAVSRFFVDPGRKYAMNLQVLEGEVESLRAKLDASTAAQKEEKEALRKTFEEELHERAREAKEQEEAQSHDFKRQLDDLEKRLDDERAERGEQQLRFGGFVRLGVCLLVLLIIEGLLAFYANGHGAGDTVLQRVVSAWPALIAAFAIGLVITRIVVGRDRIRAMGWSAHFLGAGDGDSA